MNDLVLGIPDGSMMDPERGGLKKILDKIDIEDSYKTIIQRPQELPYLASIGACDAYFCGDDWVEEWRLRGYPSDKIIGLDIGKVNLVAAGKDLKGFSVKRAASEYPFIAKKYLEDNYGAEDVQIIRYGEPMKEYSVIDSMGKTEWKLVYGIADIIIENTQTGRTLKSLGLDVKENLFSSECGLYSRQNLDKKRLKEINKLAGMLEEAIK